MPKLVESLVDVRDEVAMAKALVAAAYMACQALSPGSHERSALSAVNNAAREALEAVLHRLDQMISANR